MVCSSVISYMAVSVCLLLTLQQCAAAINSEIPFRYGWRFKYGQSPDGGHGPEGWCTNFESVDMQTCTNMYNNPNRFSDYDCMAACCYNPDCYVWQHEDSGRQCFHGGKNATCSASTKSDYQGGVRPSAQPLQIEYQYGSAAYDDSTWELVSAPHDAIITNGTEFSPNADLKHGHRLRNVTWYRKHFKIPTLATSTGATVVMIHFEGVFHYSQFWLNGEYLGAHTAGYTGFALRIDNATSYAVDKEMVLAVRSDATYGSGHWYEGGGLYRDVKISFQPTHHITKDGIFVEPTWNVTSRTVSVELTNDGDASSTVIVNATLVTDAGPLATGATTQTLAAGQTGSIVITLDKNPSLTKWSQHNPALYRVMVNTFETVGESLESASVTVGFRDVTFSGNDGMHVNGNHIKFRGFSHHNSIGGLGVAIPPRINLFRVQAQRAVGGNVWRMSHNPYVPHLYDLLDTLGVMVWDENRDYGLEYAQEMHDMVKRDRNHPSIVLWSFCNEYECKQVDNRTGLAFRAAALGVDTSRLLAANGPTNGLDVQGFSHSGNSTFINFHKEFPDMPTVLSECCSCNSQRGDARTIPTCVPDQNSPGLLPYVSGSLGVWTLMDYFGEPSAWPAVSCNFGQFDMAGYPKPHAYWYRVNWLGLLSADNPGRPALPAADYARITDLGGQIESSVNVIATTPVVEVVVDGKSLGKQNVDPLGTPVVFELPAKNNDDNCSASFTFNLTSVQCHGLDHMKDATDAASCAEACCNAHQCNTWQYASEEGCWVGMVSNHECGPAKAPWQGAGRDVVGPKTVQLYAIDSQDKIVANHTVQAPGAPVKLVAVMDVPSLSTGTGQALSYDGSDTAMIRVYAADVDGNLYSSAVTNVSFAVSGPGYLNGIANGDPNLHVQPKASSVPLYNGLTRAFVTVDGDCMSMEMPLVQMVDIDTSTKLYTSCPFRSNIITLTAWTSDGSLASTTIDIPVSTSGTDLPHVVAAASFDTAFTYLDDFQG